MLELKDTSNPNNPAMRWHNSWYQFDEYDGPDLINSNLKESMLNILGQETVAEEFWTLVREHGFSADIRPLNNTLGEEGMKVIKTRRKVKGEVRTFYTVTKMSMKLTDSEPYFYPKERVPLA